MIPVLTLIDDNGFGYSFPKDFWLTSYDLNINVNIQNYTYAAGGKNTADGYPTARTITIEGILRADTLAELETKRRTFFLAMLKGGKLQKSDDTVSRYLTVRYGNFSYSQGDWRNSEKVTVTFIAENPFWVDAAETVHTEVISSDPTNFSVDATGSDFIILPIIEIDNDQGQDNPSIKLTNTTDGNSFFEYNDASFNSGDVLEIDSFTGKVLKNGSDAFEWFTSPWFLRLTPASNSFIFEGSDCTVRIKYRKVYI